MGQIRVCDVCNCSTKENKIGLYINGMLGKPNQYNDGYQDNSMCFSFGEPNYDIKIQKELCLGCSEKINKYLAFLTEEADKVNSKFNDMFNRKD